MWTTELDCFRGVEHFAVMADGGDDNDSVLCWRFLADVAY